MDIKSSPPMRITKEYVKLYPEIYAIWNDIHTEYAEVDQLAKHIPGDVIQSSIIASVIGATGQWRKNKTIYDFDVSLSEELYSQADKVSITPDVLHMPYSTIYIRPNYGDLIPFGRDTHVQYDGFFASVDIDRDYGCPVIYFLPLSRRGVPYLPIALGFPKGANTIQECIDRISDISQSQFDAGAKTGHAKADVIEMYSHYKTQLAQWINLLLYLSAVNADVKRDPQHFFRRTKKISDVPKEVDYLHVGQSVGVHLRTLHQRAAVISQPGTGHHRSPVMHIRRAHWHTYHIGSGRQRSELKWLAPIVVNQDGTPADFTTVFKVPHM